MNLFLTIVLSLFFLSTSAFAQNGPPPNLRHDLIRVAHWVLTNDRAQVEDLLQTVTRSRTGDDGETVYDTSYVYRIFADADHVVAIEIRDGQPMLMVAVRLSEEAKRLVAINPNLLASNEVVEVPLEQVTTALGLA